MSIFNNTQLDKELTVEEEMMTYFSYKILEQGIAYNCNGEKLAENSVLDENEQVLKIDHMLSDPDRYKNVTSVPVSFHS